MPILKRLVRAAACELNDACLAFGTDALGLELHQFLDQHTNALAQDIGLLDTMLAQHLNAILGWSAIGGGSSHQVLISRDENQLTAVRVDGLV